MHRTGKKEPLSPSLRSSNGVSVKQGDDEQGGACPGASGPASRDNCEPSGEQHKAGRHDESDITIRPSPLLPSISPNVQAVENLRRKRDKQQVLASVSPYPTRDKRSSKDQDSSTRKVQEDVQTARPSPEKWIPRELEVVRIGQHVPEIQPSEDSLPAHGREQDG